jgi:hypothetical protein
VFAKNKLIDRMRLRANPGVWMSTLKKKNKSKYAEESTKTRRAREKLKRQLQAIDAKINPDALQQARLDIHRWIARHAHHRVVLRNKNISLFDENQNTANLSNRVANLAHAIQNEPQPPLKSLKEMHSIVQEKIDQ